MQQRAIRHFSSLVAGLVLSAAAPGGASAADCSHDSFKIDGRPVTVDLCVVAAPAARASGGPSTVEIQQTFASADSSFSSRAQLELLAGADSARSIEDVALAKLGINRMLHLTIGYAKGHVRLDHALLVPGAVPLK
ncbi:MAG: hypothetical protein ACREM6_16490 [Vulcanimicrobiaceae bacterium]